MTLADDFHLLTMSHSGAHVLPAVVSEAALGAAVLIGLREQRRITFDRGRVNVVDPTPTDDVILDDGLARLQTIKSMRPLYTVRRIGRLSRRRLRDASAIDGTRRQVLADRIRPVVEHGTTAPEDLNALIGLMYVTNSFDHIWGTHDAAASRRRGKEMLAQPWSNQDDQYVVREAYRSLTFTGVLRSAPRWLLSTTLKAAFKESLLRS